MTLDIPGKRHRVRRRTVWAALAATTAVALLAGCGSASPNPGHSGSSAARFKAAAQDKNSPITVWVDATRLPMAKAYQTAHPGVKLNVVTYSGDAGGSSDLQTKIELDNRRGSGWPDVVFSENPADTTWATYMSDNWLAPLNQGLIPQATLSNFAPGALAVCTANGAVYCLRNDLAQDVLWYNAKLMHQFGYQVPTTWEDYQALGAKVASEHPGYIIGAAGDSYTSDIYFAASRCQAGEVTGNTITVDTTSPNCKRAAGLLDAGIANKSITTLSAFSSDFTKKYAAKTLMLVGPSWYGQYVFNATLKVPAGQIAAANPLKWADEPQAYTGNVGGGIWMVSRHSKNLAAASAFVTAMTTDNDIQVKAPTYPAYAPAAVAWLANPTNAKYFANDVSGPFKTAAAQVWTGWSATRFSGDNVWSTAVLAGITNGKKVSSLLDAWQTAIVNHAKLAGYTVKTS
jgi:multiple sugar transport system substrate-binding protein